MSGKNVDPDSIGAVIGRLNFEVRSIIETLRLLARDSGMEIAKENIRDNFNFVIAAADKTAIAYDLASFRLNSRQGKNFSAAVQKRHGSAPYFVRVYGLDASWVEILPSDVRDAGLWQIANRTGPRNIPVREFLGEIQQSTPVMASAAHKDLLARQIHEPFRSPKLPEAPGPHFIK